MPKQIILLTGDTEFPILSEALLPHNPALEILHANTDETLEAALGKCDLSPIGARLIFFSLNVIVPASVLNRLGEPAYNLHPGPPEYPGSHPDCFAIYDGATRFGATLHEMIAKVDAGPIVKVSEFDIPQGVDSLELALRQRAFNSRCSLVGAVSLMRTSHKKARGQGFQAAS